ncbi:hypothetical protein AB0K09_05710 [Streptomyces sp. NPDC049577]|uniref:hypothetical protein n=1 Tax=Streptomyces sp. NPDC049577 TaxID=3155153 RepID=UPI00344180D4
MTEAEFADHLAWEQGRRDRAMLLGDPQQQPDFGPMPRPSDCTTTVFACAEHAIGLEAAARIHQATCTAPAPEDLPGCDCTPELVPTPDGDPAPDIAVALPPGWA